MQVDVIVIGLGPVGCLASILLSKAGLTVAAVERDATVYKLPRAVNLDGEIVRGLQPWGLAQPIADLLQPYRPGERAGFANAQREWMFGNRLSDFGNNGWQSLNMFDQPELEGYLRRTALTQAGVHGFVDYQAAAPIDEADGVSVDIRGSKHHTLKGQYVLACDGAGSLTRKSLDIGWKNLGYDHDWLVVDVTTRPGHTLGLDTLQVCDPERISTYVCTKDPYRRWEFKLKEGETWDEMLEPTRIKALIDPWTPQDTYEIRRAAMYQFHAATAETWQAGRIFLVGDAAHQTPPFLGQGMNMGMRDAINIAWKLSMVLNGQAAPTLLNEYESERKAHAHDLVDWAVSIGLLMEHFAAVAAAEAAGLPTPELDPSLLAAGYGQAREMPPLRTGVLREEQVADDSPTGHLLTQPLVTDDKETTRLDEHFGSGFALVSNKHANAALDSEAQAILQKLSAPEVSLCHLEEVKGHFDHGLDNCDWLLIRPDRYVFGHTTDQLDASALVKSLADQLHLI